MYADDRWPDLYPPPGSASVSSNPRASVAKPILRGAPDINEASALEKDGGKIDALTGATISSSATVKAVRKAMKPEKE